MTVPRKVSPFISCKKRCLFIVLFSSIHTLQRCPSDMLLSAVSARPVGSVPGRPVPRHGRPRPRPGGRGVVCRQERRPHPHLPQRRLRLHEEPRPEGGEGERPGDQAGHKSGEHLDRPEARLPACLTALSGESWTMDSTCPVLYKHDTLPVVFCLWLFPFNCWFYSCLLSLINVIITRLLKHCCDCGRKTVLYYCWGLDSTSRSNYYGWNNSQKLWISTYFGIWVTIQWSGRGKC